MPPDDFNAFIRENIGNAFLADDNRRLWAVLTDPRVVGATVQALTDAFRDIEDQLARAKARMVVTRQECFEMGPQGKQRWFTALKEHEEWRSRALGYRSILQRAMSEAKRTRLAHLTASEPPGTVTPAGVAPPPNPAKRRRNLDALFRLAYAVDKHRQQCEAEGITPEVHDLELWRKLDDITTQSASRGDISLAEWLDDITSREEFGPRADM